MDEGVLPNMEGKMFSDGSDDESDGNKESEDGVPPRAEKSMDNTSTSDGELQPSKPITYSSHKGNENANEDLNESAVFDPLDDKDDDEPLPRFKKVEDSR